MPLAGKKHTFFRRTVEGKSIFSPTIFTYSDGSTSYSLETNISSLSYDHNKILKGINIGTIAITIAENAFTNITTIDSLTFDNNSRLTDIGQMAFQGCTNLTSIILPNSLININDNAFAYCIQLNNLILGNNLTAIGIGGFANCTSLTRVRVTDSVVSIGSYCFYNCSSLNRLTGTASSLITIGDYAFSFCNSLITINSPRNLGLIGYNIFDYCNNLTTINFLGEKPNTSYPPPGEPFLIGSNASVYYCSDKTSWIGTTDFGGRPVFSRVC